MNFNNGGAWKEAFIDTALGASINIPLNTILLYVALWCEWSVITTSLVLSAVFTVIAIVRKYILRNYFETKKLHSE